MLRLKKSVLLSSVLLTVACQKSDLNNSEIQINELEKKSSSSEKYQWQLPELNLQEKKDLVSSVKTVFNDFYVNRNQKVIDYNYDAIAQANKLDENMDSENLLKSTMEIFFNIRDLHTGFIYPVPARCYSGGFPITVGLSYDEKYGYKERLIVSAKLTPSLSLSNVSAEAKSDFEALSVGDEILTIRNIGIEGYENQEIYANTAIDLIGKIGRGANPEAFKSRALQRLFSRNGRYIKIPEGNFTLKVKRASDGKIVKYTLPWLTYVSGEQICNDYFNKKSPRIENGLESIDNSVENIYEKNNKKNEETFVKDLYTNSTSNQNIVKYIAKYKRKSIAVIRINRFIPDGDFSYSDYLVARKYIENEVNDIRKFIMHNRSKIQGVLIDVRGNGGGFGSFPQLIANAFTHKFVKNLEVRPLVSKTNRDTFYNLEMSRYFARLNTTDPMQGPNLSTVNEMDSYLADSNYSEQIQSRTLLLSSADRYDGDENDALPETYNKKDTEILKPVLTIKPIAVLTNSNCYSACDVFVSLMKDYKIAKIFGTAKQTGGGGANVIEWKDFLTPVVVDELGTKISIIPNGSQLPRNSEIRFAWNKIYRPYAVKDYEKYIEGVGVVTDYVYRQTTQDLINNDKIVFRKIFEDLIDPKNSKGFYLKRW
ncbi:S41 family peptidase [Fluviispira vulneris]|uniref:S41 family peptidase n=1 Tax=Fluviispira vulneris TaxID=2763012 RepID=UPI001647094A|nr:S41 family peptidase [Fluviispira vulneris]